MDDFLQTVALILITIILWLDMIRDQRRRVSGQADARPPAQPETQGTQATPRGGEHP